MDTIAINAGESLNEKGQAKKKIKLNDTTKAAMATGAAGVAAGMTVKSVEDSVEENAAEETTASTENQSTQSEDIMVESELAEAVTAEVNPDDVMLEEPIAETSSESDMLAEAAPQSGDNDYKPFAGNDIISEEILPEPQLDVMFIAENTDLIYTGDDVCDIICLPNTSPEIIDEPVSPETELYADNDISYDDSDIQSDLMA